MSSYSFRSIISHISQLAGNRYERCICICRLSTGECGERPRANFVVCCFFEKTTEYLCEPAVVVHVLIAVNQSEFFGDEGILFVLSAVTSKQSVLWPCEQ